MTLLQEVIEELGYRVLIDDIDPGPLHGDTVQRLVAVRQVDGVDIELDHVLRFGKRGARFDCHLQVPMAIVRERQLRLADDDLGTGWDRWRRRLGGKPAFVTPPPAGSLAGLALYAHDPVAARALLDEPGIRRALDPFVHLDLECAGMGVRLRDPHDREITRRLGSTLRAAVKMATGAAKPVLVGWHEDAARLLLAIVHRLRSQT